MNSPPPPTPAALPQAPPPPPMFGAPTQGQRPKRKPATPTFLGSELSSQVTPQGGLYGTKTLLGT